MSLLSKLAAEGADFKIVDYRGRGPIHVAAEKGDLSIVKFLVEEMEVDFDLVDM